MTLIHEEVNCTHDVFCHREVHMNWSIKLSLLHPGDISLAQREVPRTWAHSLAMYFSELYN